MKELGLLVMTYGSPESTDDVREYLTNIRRGRPPEEEMVEDFKRRYEKIGGSPLTKITRQQASATAKQLEHLLEQQGSDLSVKPYVGMRYFHPYIDEAVDSMIEDDIDHAIGLIMSPQYSPVLMKGYLDDLKEAIEERSDAPEVNVIETWWEEPLYHRAVSMRIQEALDEYPEDVRDDVPLLLTAHSIPRSVWEKDPDYVDQLKNTAERIGEMVNHDWEFAYQSAGHTKEEWLKPDMTDLFPGLAEDGHEHVLIAPFQFLADHLEILYDIDVEARKQAEEEGLEFKRIKSLNAYTPFIQAMTKVCADKIHEEGFVESPLKVEVNKTPTA